MVTLTTFNPAAAILAHNMDELRKQIEVMTPDEVKRLTSILVTGKGWIEGK